MSAKITFFPVGNGDMTLITLIDETNILIDVNIRTAADNPEDDACDVSSELRKRIKTDDKGRPYVDVFVLSHPDKDHCTGLKNHFHLGKPDDYVDEPPETGTKKEWLGIRDYVLSLSPVQSNKSRD
jgi:Cft2 family RNA processing exonuclease